MRHYELEINLYLDKELPHENESEMFLHLSGCEDCRKTFHSYRSIKEKSNIHFQNKYENITSESKKEFNTYKIVSYISSVAAIILLFVLSTHKPAPTYIGKNETRVDTVSVQNQSISNSSLTPGKKEFVSASQKEYLHYVLSLRTEVFTKADLIQSDNGSIQ